MLKRIVDFEVAPPRPSDSRGIVALVASAILHVGIILLLIFGIPVSGGATLTPAPSTSGPQAIAIQPPLGKPKPLSQQQKEEQQKPQPPPPPLKEVELGPDSKNPDAPAKEAAAKENTPAPATAAAKTPAPDPTPASAEAPTKPTAEPPAPQHLTVPKPGDYSGAGPIPMPTTSPWGPPKFDAASGEAAPAPAANVARNAMGPMGATSRDPAKWENSFDDQTSGRCVDIPELGKNSDGSPVLSTVFGRVLDTDGKRPLSGAHLQIVGTQYGTFSDNNGEYKLAFDPHMLAKCRKQYVDVVAPGYRGAQLTLMIGPKVRSDDVILRHH